MHGIFMHINMISVLHAVWLRSTSCSNRIFMPMPTTCGQPSWQVVVLVLMRHKEIVSVQCSPTGKRTKRRAAKVDFRMAQNRKCGREWQINVNHSHTYMHKKRPPNYHGKPISLSLGLLIIDLFTVRSVRLFTHVVHTSFATICALRRYRLRCAHYSWSDAGIFSLQICNLFYSTHTYREIIQSTKCVWSHRYQLDEKKSTTCTWTQA